MDYWYQSWEDSIISKLQSSKFTGGIYCRFIDSLYPFIPFINPFFVPPGDPSTIPYLSKDYSSVLHRSLSVLPNILMETPNTSNDCAMEFLDVYRLCIDCLDIIAPELGNLHASLDHRYYYICCLRHWKRYDEAKSECKIVLDKFNTSMYETFGYAREEYKGDDSQIPSGSSVIVKRVPGGAAPSVVSSTEAAKIIGAKDSSVLKPCGRNRDEFFGVDIAHVPDSELPQFDLEIDANNLIGNEMEDIPDLRLECQKLDSSDISQAVPRGSNPHVNEKNIIQEDKAVEQMKLNKLPTSNFLAVQSTNLPLELKCSLCQTFFKEAVMIPCCQHSFCDKCIRLVLTDKGRCPKCFSSKCNVGDLLPNLSLRQAIEHFLESQMDDADIDKAMQKYVPDGESGIQARDVSCALTVQRERDLPQSSFAIGNGSNQRMRQTSALRGGLPYHGNMQSGYEDCAPPDDFQGENQPFVVPQTNIHGAGGHRSLAAFGGQKKVRACYICGSPDHLMRDCPASNPNPMFQPGNGAFRGGMPEYAPPYWNGSSMPPFRPYANMYGNPAMMSYNAPFQVSPFTVPPYMPSMYGGMPPGPSGNMRPHQSEYFELQHSETNRTNEDLPRERLSDDEDDSPERYHNSYPEKSHDYKPQKHKEPSLSHSGDSLTRRLGRRSQQHDKYADERYEKSSHPFAGRDNKKPHYAEKSNSGLEEIPKSEGRYKHHGESNKYHHDRREHSDLSLGNRSAQKDVKRRGESDIRDSHKKTYSHSDYSYEPTSPHEQRHRYNKEGGDIGHDSRHYRHSDRSAQKDVKKRDGSDVRDFHKKTHSHSDYSYEPTSPHEQRHRHKESDIGHDSRHYRHGEKQSKDRRDDRRQMDEEDRDEHGHHHKRKRIY